MQENGRKRKRVAEEESWCLNPPGFRFLPTEQDLISYFLYNKVTKNPLCDTEYIQDFDLYGSTEPWQIWDMFGGPRLEENSEGKDGDLDLYFFTKLKKMSSKGSNFIRKVGSGSWQGEAKPKKIYADHPSNNCIGSMRRFRYENKNIPLQHGAWIMHEFSLQASTLPSSSSTPLPSDFVVCRFRKNDKTHKRKKLNKSQNQGKVNDGDHQTIGGDDSFSSSSCIPPSSSMVYSADDDQTIGHTREDNFSSSSCLPPSSSRVYNDEPIEASGDDRFCSPCLPASSSKVYNDEPIEASGDDRFCSPCLPASSSRVYNDEPIEASGDDSFSSPCLPASSSVQDVTDLFTDEEFLLTDLFTFEELLQGLPQPEMQENWAGDDMLAGSSILSYEELLESSYSMQKSFLPDGAEELENGHDELLTSHTDWAQTFAQELLGCQTCLV